MNEILLDLFQRSVKKASASLLMTVLLMGLVATSTGCGGGGGGGAPSITPANTVNFNVSPATGNSPLTVTLTLTHYSAKATTTDGSVTWGDNSVTALAFNDSGSLKFQTQHLYALSGSYGVRVQIPSIGYDSGTSTVTVIGSGAQGNNNPPTLSPLAVNPSLTVAINDLVTINATPSDTDPGDQATVACDIDYGDQSLVVVNQTCTANNTHRYQTAGVFTIRFVPKDRHNAVGAAQTANIVVTGTPAGAPQAPNFSVTNIPGLSGSVNANSVTISGNKGNDCVNLFSSHQTQAIVSTTQTTWSYTFPLQVEGANLFNLRCANSSGQQSVNTPITLYRKTLAPTAPIVNTPPNTTVNTTIALTGTKPRDCNLWLRVPGTTDQMIDDLDTYDTSNRNQPIGWNVTVNLVNTGQQNVELWCKDDVVPNPLESIHVPVTVNNTQAGGGGNQTGQNPPTCTGFTVTPTSGNTGTIFTANLALGGTCTDQRVSWGDGTPDYVDNTCSTVTTTHNYNNGNWSPTIFRNNSAANGGSCQLTVLSPIVVGAGSGSGGSFNYQNESTVIQMDEITTDGVSVYGVSSANNAIYKYTPAGALQNTFLTLTGMPAGESLTGVSATAYCPTGEFFVATGTKVYKATLGGAWVATLPNTYTGISGMGCKTANGTTRLYIADAGGSKVASVDPATGAQQWLTAAGQPRDVDVDSNGMVYYTSWGSNSNGYIGRISNAGVGLTNIGPTVSLPTRLAINTYTAGVDTLLIGENGTSKIEVMDTGGTISTSFGGPGNSGGLTTNISGIAVIGGLEVIAVASNSTNNNLGRLVNY
ncbi:MAG: hypothetical protein WC045_01225 [Patescibacteria group bacterium]